MNYRIILGHLLNPINDKRCDFVKDGALLLKKKGKEWRIEKCGKRSSILAQLKLNGNGKCEILDYSNDLIMPSFFDMHFHWVQDDIRQMPKDSLLEWLSKYTWPHEAEFQSKRYAKAKAREFFQRLARAGTLGGACFSSIHPHALKYAFQYSVGSFVMGNVLMTMNSPDYLVQTKNNAIQLVNKFSSLYKERYALTPRFALTVHPDVMKSAALSAQKNKSFIQTHLSENVDEINFVLDVFKNLKGFEKIKSYTDIYRKCFFLGNRTIMGHAIHLSSEELRWLAKTKTAIAHCPTSNAPIIEQGLGSGLFDFRRAEKAGVRWALASDIGGGPHLSMFDVMRSFVDQNFKCDIRGATFTKALYRSTLAGAEILRLQKTEGNLGKGKWANFIVCPMPNKKGLKMEAETVLRSLILPLRSKRNEYDNLPRAVFYRGNIQ